LNSSFLDYASTSTARLRWLLFCPTFPCACKIIGETPSLLNSPTEPFGPLSPGYLAMGPGVPTGFGNWEGSHEVDPFFLLFFSDPVLAPLRSVEGQQGSTPLALLKNLDPNASLPSFPISRCSPRGVCPVSPFSPLSSLLRFRAKEFVVDTAFLPTSTPPMPDTLGSSG